MDYEYRRKGKEKTQDFMFDASFFKPKCAEDDDYQPEGLSEEVLYTTFKGHNFVSPKCFNSINGDLLHLQYGTDVLMYQILRITPRQYLKDIDDIEAFVNLEQGGVAESVIKRVMAQIEADERDMAEALRDLSDMMLKERELKENLQALARKVREQRIKLGKGY